MAELILALDLPSDTQAIALVDTLVPQLRWCKVGMEMFTRYGPALIQKLLDRHLSVFLDLKFYDIPHTVERAVCSARSLGVSMLTLHCQGGARMLAGAVAAKEKAATPLLFGVTALTSFGPNEMPGIAKDPSLFASDLADLAATSHLDGIVCSPKEVPAIKARHPHLLCLCPGIRPAWACANDQRRVASPKEAVALGCDYLVVGRPILEAQDPKKATALILDEIALS
ncbi:MAG: orotidine-5'-phosphate decarboxylase [Desulfovibrio sp.]|nr:orotidine-5'-phosphate decarboxylase [Desulfovibrio sp.]